ncbi:PAS domain-containing protein [Phenylobacterium sp.]|uniref:PAS domain-containing protein n=1 Tax=Phenylobacterium sp. TaxID=1871053 RepID=UPI002F9339DA
MSSDDIDTAHRRAGPEERFRLIIDAAPTPMWVTRLDRTREFVNQAYMAFVGLPYDEALIFDWRNAIHPDDIQRVFAEQVEKEASLQPFTLEARYRNAQGEWRWLRSQSQPRWDAEGRHIGFVGTAYDVTAEKAEEARRAALLELADRLRDLDDTAEISFAAAEILGRTLEVSRAGYGTVDPAAETIRIERDWNAPGIQSLAGVLNFRDYGSYIEDLKRGETVVFADAETDPRTAATADALKAISAQAVVNMPIVEQGGVVALLYLNHATARPWPEEELAFIREVAERTRSAVERRRVEQELRDSRARFVAIANSIDQMVWSTAPDGYHDYYNQRWYDYTGVPEGSTDGDAWNGIFHPEDRDRAWTTWSRCLETGETYHIEYRLRHRSGQYRWVLGRAQPVRDEAGRITRWFGTCTDIQEIVEAREVLARSRAELEREVAERTRERDRVWRNSRDLLIVSTAEGLIRAVNPAWSAILGYAPDELVGRNFVDFVWPEDAGASADAHRVAVEAHDLTSFENRFRHKEGGVRWISWHTSREGELVYGYGRDVTEERQAAAELRKAEEALRQSQKLEAMGQLTGGVAHDFNNLLTPIVGGLDVLQRRGLGGDRERRLIEGALQSAERAKMLVQRLLAFARRQPLRPSAVNVPELIVGMADLVASTSGPQVKVVVDLPKDLPPAKADPNQLEMAILNLSVNARDAMPDGGVLRISAGVETVGPSDPTGLSPGGYVRISVADSGVGMDEATAARAIEPFFSTKGVGKGTGLGLSMVHGLASQLGGALKISSRLGLGTNIELWLPLTDEAAAEGAAASDRSAAPGAGLALLVDDEELVRASTAVMLSELGYQVSEAASGEAALRLMDEGLRPDVLVTDYLMPGMTGVDLIRALHERRPGLPALVVSGYAEVDALDPALPRLTKPFRASELAAGLERLRA